jgi:beta-aspartyl-peptidase (threonine type)
VSAPNICLKHSRSIMPTDEQGWAIIAHGGAKEIHSDEAEAHRVGMRTALAVGQNILAKGGTALEAVELVVRALEANPVFNAGLGSARNGAGEIQMDASIMDGATLDIGAVAGIQDFEHPVSIARALLRESPILLVGEKAADFARKAGFGSVIDEGTAQLRKSGCCDTVGCVARDRQGNLAVATSTGGLEGSMPGRVGDVPLPGCGFYAANGIAGVSLSGHGEMIARVLAASGFLHQLPAVGPQVAADAALELVRRLGGEAGLIAITADGSICWTHNSPEFAVALAEASKPDIQVYLSKSEAQ